MFFNVPAEPHLSKRLLFFLTAKITRSARLEKNVVYVAKIGGEISDFVCPVYFYHHPRPPTVYFQEKSIEDCALILGIPAISKDCMACTRFR